jgi:hypothetical protein
MSGEIVFARARSRQRSDYSFQRAKESDSGQWSVQPASSGAVVRVERAHVMPQMILRPQDQPQPLRHAYRTWNGFEGQVRPLVTLVRDQHAERDEHQQCVRKSEAGLVGIIGRHASDPAEGMTSRAMSDLVWTEAVLDEYLAGPSNTVHGTIMPIGISNAQDRADLIGYIKTLR